METRTSFPTIWDRTATIPPSRRERIPTRVRWGLLRRTGMGYTIWRVMSLSGVGIGMGGRMLEAPTHAAPRQAPSVWCGAVTGTASPPGARWRSATALSRWPASTASGSGLCCPQVSELERAEQSRRSEGRAETDCGAGVSMPRAGIELGCRFSPPRCGCRLPGRLPPGILADKR